MNDIERELRESLAENARRAPAGDGLAERIIADAQFGRGAHERRTARSRWRAWSLPAIAAACVAGVVASIAIVASLQHPKTHSANTPSLSVTPPTGSAASSEAPATTTAPSSIHATSGASTSAVPGIGLVPKGFQVADLTFASAEEGWALGTGQCFQAPSQRCTALLRTTDGGESWVSVMNPPATIGGTCDKCIEHIRFANDKVGYAYGQNVLLMTTDGGAEWIHQKGGADALETLSGNVIRVADGGGCPPGCTYQVLTAAVGSGQWQAAPLPGTVSGDSVLLNRTGHAAYLLIQQHPAGGAGMQQPTLLTSSDDGHTWADSGHTPCPQGPGSAEIDASLMTTAEDGSLALVCTERGGLPRAQFTVTSTDGGTTFRRGSTGAFSSLAGALAAASGSVLLVSGDDTYRSINGGHTWLLSAAGPGKASWIGFENATVGRAISADYRTIWTTRDAGATWSSHTFQ
jgi:hypothetical protein